MLLSVDVSVAPPYSCHVCLAISCICSLLCIAAADWQACVIDYCRGAPANVIGDGHNEQTATNM